MFVIAILFFASVSALLIALALEDLPRRFDRQRRGRA